MFYWRELKTGFTVLAPMEDVTDTVFRRIVALAGRPEVFFTEFTNAEGLLSKGRARIIERFLYTKEEHPIIAQIWGLSPEALRKAAETVAEMGFDGVDLNMGCPKPKVVKRGSGAGMIGNPNLALEQIAAVKEGAKGLPVSVKTRIGISEIVTEDWIGHLLKQNLNALTVHVRTQKEMSNVPAHWDEFYKIVKLRNEISPNTVLIGNGDVQDRMDGQEKCIKYGIEGTMIGRGIFKNIYAFSDIKIERTPSELLALLIKHIELHKEAWLGKKNYHGLKKFYQIYVKGFKNASKLKKDLYLTSSHDEAISVIEKFLSNHLEAE